MTNSATTRVTFLGLAVLALAACGKKDNNAADTTAASSTMTTDTSAMTGAASSTSSTGNWSDANIVALLDEANAADSTAGSVAATKGTAAAVRDFARRMERDHHQLRAQGAALAKKLNVTPAAPSDDPVQSMASSETNTLNRLRRARISTRPTLTLKSVRTRQCSI